VNGYTDATFRPDQKITREEAMVMYFKAMKITKMTGNDTFVKIGLNICRISTSH
jgi:hypothetical protein